MIIMSEAASQLLSTTEATTTETSNDQTYNVQIEIIYFTDIFMSSSLYKF
jgi:hypothetical protein